MYNLQELSDQKVLGYIINEQTKAIRPKILESNDLFLKFRADLQDGDEINRNRRLYGTPVLAEGIIAPHLKVLIETKNLFGECGHPLSMDINRQKTIDMLRASHLITKLYMDGNMVKSEIETANNTAGRDFRGLIEQGCLAAFSMRGFSKVVEQKKDYADIKGPLHIVTYDWVN